MVFDAVFDFDRVDVFAVVKDHVTGSAVDGQNPVFEPSDVTRVKPEIVVESFGGGFVVVPVAEHRVGAFRHDAPVFAVS